MPLSSLQFAVRSKISSSHRLNHGVNETHKRRQEPHQIERNIHHNEIDTHHIITTNQPNLCEIFLPFTNGSSIRIARKIRFFKITARLIFNCFSRLVWAVVCIPNRTNLRCETSIYHHLSVCAICRLYLFLLLLLLLRLLRRHCVSLGCRVMLRIKCRLLKSFKFIMKIIQSIHLCVFFRVHNFTLALWIRTKPIRGSNEGSKWQKSHNYYSNRCKANEGAHERPIFIDCNLHAKCEYLWQRSLSIW